MATSICQFVTNKIGKKHYDQIILGQGHCVVREMWLASYSGTVNNYLWIIRKHDTITVYCSNRHHSAHSWQKMLMLYIWKSSTGLTSSSQVTSGSIVIGIFKIMYRGGACYFVVKCFGSADSETAIKLEPFVNTGFYSKASSQKQAILPVYINVDCLHRMTK